VPPPYKSRTKPPQQDIILDPLPHPSHPIVRVTKPHNSLQNWGPSTYLPPPLSSQVDWAIRLELAPLPHPPWTRDKVKGILCHPDADLASAEY
jgi:hypothetical protein